MPRTSTPPRRPRCSWSPAGRPPAGRSCSRPSKRAGQSTAGQRGIHLLGILCQRGWLVQGPLAGNQQLVVAFDDWITESRTLDRADGIAEWLLRYLRSHGPATERDFSWWSGIPADGGPRGPGPGVRTSWWSWSSRGPATGSPRKRPRCSTTASRGQRTVLALPGFDEFLLGYTDRSLVLPPEHADKIVPGGNGVFKKTIVAGGQVIGTWAGSAQTAGRRRRA